MADARPDAVAAEACRRHRLSLVELLPGRAGASLFVARVRDGAGAQLVLKQTAPETGAHEIVVLKLLSGSGLTPRFVGELGPGAVPGRVGRGRLARRRAGGSGGGGR